MDCRDPRARARPPHPPAELYWVFYGCAMRELAGNELLDQLGLALETPETVQAATFPLIYPLMFASSIFVPVETMPGWLQDFVKVNPITLVTDTVRAPALGEPFDLMPDLAWAALAMVAILAVFVPLAISRYRRT